MRHMNLRPPNIMLGKFKLSKTTSVNFKFNLHATAGSS